MRNVIRLMALVALAGCSAGVMRPDSANDPLGVSNDAISTTDGPLKLTVSDTTFRPGVMFTAGSIAGGQGTVTVMSTRYGSLCSTSITAHADVASGTITLRVKFAERLTVCTAEIRAITYRAEVGSLAAGTYDVNVIHTNADGTTSTVLAQRVKVL